MPLVPDILAFGLSPFKPVELYNRAAQRINFDGTGQLILRFLLSKSRTGTSISSRSNLKRIEKFPVCLFKCKIGAFVLLTMNYRFKFFSGA